MFNCKLCGKSLNRRIHKSATCFKCIQAQKDYTHVRGQLTQLLDKAERVIRKVNENKEH